jgi:hypothetical protein
VTVHPGALLIQYSWKRPRVVFVNSMSDLFHARVPLDFIQQAFGVMADTPHHTYQVLTKRARRLTRIADKLDWPSNVWMGGCRRAHSDHLPHLLLRSADAEPAGHEARQQSVAEPSEFGAFQRKAHAERIQRIRLAAELSYGGLRWDKDVDSHQIRFV